MLEKKLLRAGRENYFSSNIIETIINPTDICNFKCSYCCNKEKRAEGRSLPLNILKEFIEDLGARKADKYIFKITGGEPLLYKYKYDLLNFLVNYIPIKPHLHFITNGSLISENLKIIDEFSELIHIKFLISIHLAQIEIEKLLLLIDRIKNTNLLTFKFLLTPGSLKRVIELEKTFSSAGFKTFILPIFDQKSKIIEYPPQEIKFLESFPMNNRVIFTHEYQDMNSIIKVPYTLLDKNVQPETFSYKGLNCAAGLNTLRLGPDGTVLPCLRASIVGSVFNLHSRRLRDIPELNKPCICRADRCTCQLFLRTPKWSAKEYAPAYLADL